MPKENERPARIGERHAELPTFSRLAFWIFPRAVEGSLHTNDDRRGYGWRDGATKKLLITFFIC